MVPIFSWFGRSARWTVDVKPAIIDVCSVVYSKWGKLENAAKGILWMEEIFELFRHRVKRKVFKIPQKNVICACITTTNDVTGLPELGTAFYILGLAFHI